MNVIRSTLLFADFSFVGSSSAAGPDPSGSEIPPIPPSLKSPFRLPELPGVDPWEKSRLEREIEMRTAPMSPSPVEPEAPDTVAQMDAIHEKFGGNSAMDFVNDRARRHHLGSGVCDFPGWKVPSTERWGERRKITLYLGGGFIRSAPIDLPKSRMDLVSIESELDRI